MSRNFSVWVPIQALIFGAVAIVFSFIAYAKRIKIGDVYSFDGVCLYPSTQAWYFGLCAALEILIVQFILSNGMKCFCCNGGRRYSSKCAAIFSIIFFILSWISFVIAFVALICTAILNNHKYLEKNYGTIMSNNGKSCFVAQDNLFLGSAIWCIITTVFGLISYAVWACAVANTNNQHVSSNVEDGVAMGQPHTLLPKEQC